MESDPTMIEMLLHEHDDWERFREAENATKANEVLRNIFLDLRDELSPVDLVDHNRALYARVAQWYAKQATHQDVTEAFMRFVLRPELPKCARVLELGCGHGRDTAYMAVNNVSWREKRMDRPHSEGRTLLDLYKPLSLGRAFIVTGIDIPEMEEHFWRTFEETAHFPDDKPSFTSPGCAAGFMSGDFNNLRSLGLWDEDFDAVWSCSAFGLSTPESMLLPNLKEIARVLKPGGIFGVTYTQAQKERFEEELFLTPSDPSRTDIRYFSRPHRREFERLSRECGLVMKEEASHGFFNKETGYRTPDLFAFQVFVKQ